MASDSDFKDSQLHTQAELTAHKELGAGDGRGQGQTKKKNQCLCKGKEKSIEGKENVIPKPLKAVA